MAHPNIRKQQMLAWIEECLDASMPCPGDASICERFNLTSTESARTLLAELADAGRITIRGYGETRAITLGRQRGLAPSVPRPVPAVTKPDPVVEATTARIVDIVQRRAKPPALIGYKKSDAVRRAVEKLSSITPPAAPAVAKTAKETVMAGKTIQLPESSQAAINAVTRLAKLADLTLGQAAAQLIIEGIKPRPVAAAPTAPSAEREVTIDSIITDLKQLLSEQAASGEAVLAQAAVALEMTERATAAEARAGAAEEKLAQFKALLA